MGNNDNKFEYKIETEAENSLESVIRKTGVVSNTFTMREIMLSKEANAKSKKALQGKLDFETAKMNNVLEHHPFVKDLSGEDLVAAHMYYEAKQFVDTLPAKIADFEEFEKELEEEIKAIEASVGIAVPIASVQTEPTPSKAIDL